MDSGYPFTTNPFTSSPFLWVPAPSPEQRVDALAAQVDLVLTRGEAENLLASGEYAQSFGLRGGHHFRKNRGDGCYHLRVDGQRALLHWDAWDPRRFPVQHFFETPELWGTTAVVGVVALALGAGGSGGRK